MKIIHKIALYSGILLISISTFSYADIGQVKTVTGNAFILRNGENIDIKPGVFLEQKDVIVTADNSSVGITFIDNTRYATGSNTRLSLKRFRFNTTTHEGEFVSEIEKGTAAITSGDIAKHNHEAMKVMLPTTILAVRGTKFLVMVSE